MSVIIEGYDKPKNCYVCPFNRDDCWCSITHGGIDRDFWICDKPCPIKPFDNVLDEIKAEIAEMKMEDNSHNICFKVHNNVVEGILRIIDKYKAASEDKE